MDEVKRQEMFAVTNRPGGFTDYIGVRITRVEDGIAESRAEVTDHHMNPIGTVHGGVLMTMMDQAAGTASASVSPAGGTVNCDIHFLAPAKKGRLLCRAEVLRKGGRINVVHAQVQDDQGTLVADGTYTFSHPVQEKNE